MALATVFMLSSGFVDREEVSFLDTNNESVDFRKCEFHLHRTTTDPTTGIQTRATYHYYNVEVGDQSCEQAGNTIVAILNSMENN
jgi:hypothetical protein